MSGKTNKKTKEELADFFLSDDSGAEKSADKTAVLSNVDKDNEKTKSVSILKSKVTETKPTEFTPKPIREAPSQKQSVFNKENIDPSLFSLEAALKQSEYLRIAQNKVNSLEKLSDELKSENETLSASVIILQKKYDEVVNKLDTIKMDQRAQVDNLKDELTLKDRVLKELEKEKDLLQRKNDEFQSLMSEKIQHVRVRERELQNRLEILQQEGDVVITNKDEMILDLKKQVDQLHFEMDGYKTQSRELNQQIQDQKEQMRRSMKALRLALTLLENQNIDVSEIKKTGS